MTTTEYVMCGRCKTEEATIHDDRVEASFEIAGTLHQVTVALDCPMCESCLKAFISGQLSEVIAQEASKAAARNRAPIICDSCRSIAVQWLQMSIDDGPDRRLCGTCCYVETRDRLLIEAVKIERGESRRVAILDAMHSARNARDQAFQATWGNHERQAQ